MSDSAAEEIKLTFPKAKLVQAFSFTGAGDDFNFIIVTSLSIDLYRVDVKEQRAKILKNFPLDLPSSCPEPHIILEPIHAVVIATDPKTGICYPFFLNMQEKSNAVVKGLSFKLDMSSIQGQNMNTSMSQSMNESMISNSRMSTRQSITERAKSLIGGGPKVGQMFPGGKIPFAPFLGNKNLLTMK